MDKKLAIAVKREHRQSISGNWQEQLGSIPGVSVVGAGPNRVLVTASEEAEKKIQAEFGADCYIEEIVEREPL
jgi:hypothetical protein